MIEVERKYKLDKIHLVSVVSALEMSGFEFKGSPKSTQTFYWKIADNAMLRLTRMEGKYVLCTKTEYPDGSREEQEQDLHPDLGLALLETLPDTDLVFSRVRLSFERADGIKAEVDTVMLPDGSLIEQRFLELEVMVEDRIDADAAFAKIDECAKFMGLRQVESRSYLKMLLDVRNKSEQSPKS